MYNIHHGCFLLTHELPCWSHSSSEYSKPGLVTRLSAPKQYLVVRMWSGEMRVPRQRGILTLSGRFW